MTRNSRVVPRDQETPGTVSPAAETVTARSRDDLTVSAACTTPALLLRRRGKVSMARCS